MEETISFYDWELSFKKGTTFHSKPIINLKIQFESLLTKFCERASLHKSASIYHDDLQFIKVNVPETKIKADIKSNSSSIEIDCSDKVIKHPCHELKKLNLYHKRFCSHLIKFFTILFERDPEKAHKILKDVFTTDYYFEMD